MENGSSSSSQGQGSNNFTGGGPGGNNGNGPNPGGNNFNSPADGGNNRRNRSTFFETVIGHTKTDTDMLADYLQVKLDELNKKGVKKPKSVHGRDIALRVSPHRALKDNTLYPSMVITYLEDTHGKERVYPTFKSFQEGKASGSNSKSLCATLTPELIAHIRTFKEDVPQSHIDN